MTCKPFHELDTSESRPPQQPEDIANAIALLASDMSKTISGVVLPVDRAYSAA